MDSDRTAFLIGIIVFVVYLVFSAMTEMGTKIPDWLKNRENKDEE